jgi:hypothetical protein
MALLPFLRGLCHPPGSAFVRWASSAWWSLPQSMDSLGRQNGSPLILPFLPHLQARVLIWNSASLHFCCILEDRKIVFKILSSNFVFLAGYHEAMGLKMFHVGWTQWLISVIPATPEAEWSIPGQKKKKVTATPPQRQARHGGGTHLRSQLSTGRSRRTGPRLPQSKTRLYPKNNSSQTGQGVCLRWYRAPAWQVWGSHMLGKCSTKFQVAQVTWSCRSLGYLSGSICGQGRPL